MILSIFPVYYSVNKHPRNFLYLTASDAGSHLIGFAVTVYLARVLGPVGFGQISYAQAFLNYALLFGNLGLVTIGAREVARQQTNLDLTGDIVSIRIVLAALIFTVVTAVSLILPGTPVIRGLVIIYALTVFPFAAYLDFFFQGREEMGFISAGRIIQFGVYALLVFFIFRLSGNILAIPAVFFVSHFIAAVFLLVVYRVRKFVLPIRLINPNFGKLLAAAIPVGSAMIFYQIPLNLGPIVIKLFHTVSDIGMFSAVYKVVFSLLIIERVFYWLFLPIVSRQHQVMPERLPATFVFCLRIIFSLVLPIAAGGMVLAPAIVRFLYGSGYAPAAGILQILLVYFIATPINTVFGYGLVALGQERLFFKITALASVVGLIGVSAFGIFFGAKGVAIGLLLGEVLSLVLMKKKLTRVVRFDAMRYSFKPALAAGAMALFLILPVTSSLHLLLRTALGVIVYSVLLFIIGGFSIREIKELTGLFSSSGS